ncbi:MAG: hypothetical protein RSG56_09065 [Brevundimonas sp.]
MISIEDQIACIDRELRYRRRVYPRWIDGGKMTQRKADEEIARMEAVLATLEEKAKGSRLL